MWLEQVQELVVKYTRTMSCYVRLSKNLIVLYVERSVLEFSHDKLLRFGFNDRANVV